MNTGSRTRDPMITCFVRSHLGLNIPASPPDVRQGSALPEAVRRGQAPDQGQSPNQSVRPDRRGPAPRLTSGGEAGT